MSRCPSCGHENQPGAKFCSQCATPILEIESPAREERKVVTVVFADLVGFTSRAEQLDPEDVRAMLSPYYARLRSELVRHGGTVEKFIGDAVMALFGAPVAHEDDPERAVRAALAIRDWVLEQGELQVRIAVNTGVALVALGARSGDGEGMASGDVVNTTARLQSAAPVNGILVGEVTYRATSPVITYREVEPVTAKGKVEPVPVWEALEARSRLGSDLNRIGRAPLIGREQELDVLRDSLARVRRERTPQLVTIVGVPGIGKSRLIAELFRYVSDDPSELILWRQGRSLPYGDGVTFWALAEMVKAQSGILETDSAERAEEKLHLAVSDVIPDLSERGWVEGHLRPLAGLSGDTEGGSDRQSEAFTAWRRFFEALAEQHPLTLMFEDLHWADDHLLDFVEYLVDWVSGVPLLVVCTTRPELFERRAGWAGGKRNVTTLSLAPLTDDETAQLIASLSEQPVMPVDTQQALLVRAGGNPLYAEQYVRMLAERNAGEELPLPETVQGIIAARLDALSPEEKNLLQNAAVMGKVFWLGAVADIGRLDRHTAELHLHALERKDFVQHARRSSVGDEAEYAFLHVLVRDVAYGQIPRGQRAEKHGLAAEWIASLGRTEDHAEMLAHHYLSALELRRSAGQPTDATLAERALASLREAGDRAFSLNAIKSAARFYEAALQLAPASSTERAHLLFKLGRARVLAGDIDPTLLSAAFDELLACGESETAAEAQISLAEVSWLRGDRDRSFGHVNRASELAEELEPSRATAYVVSSVSRFLMLVGENAEAIRLGREALAMADQFGLGELRAHALDNVGVARVHSGDPGGIDDLERSAAVAAQVSAPGELCRSMFNLGSVLWEQGQLRRAVALVEDQIELSARIGHMWRWHFSRGSIPEYQYQLGQWHDALAGANEFLAEVEGGSPHVVACVSYGVRAQIRLGRDDTSGALADAERALELARLAKDPQNVYQQIAWCASVFRECGDSQRAATLADELLAELRARSGVRNANQMLHILAWTLAALGKGREMIETLPEADVPWVQAAIAFASGNLVQSAEICDAMGAVTEGARDRLWLAEALVKQNRRADADIELQRALTFYRSVGATRYIREGEALLTASA
ncbi:MAG TPA: AAA family ATPase [Candidatus Dormibacteraeota bacterium]|nr:AAA family ATPase [Candidatus Dormibacteraeota bacterium]